MITIGRSSPCAVSNWAKNMISVYRHKTTIYLFEILLDHGYKQIHTGSNQTMRNMWM